MVFETCFFAPLGLRHTWLIGYPPHGLAQSDRPADIFRGNLNITRTRYNEAYWAEGGIISTADEMIVFLKSLNEGKLIRPETLRMMHDWRKMKYGQYGFGTMYFGPQSPVMAVAGLSPLWGHQGSTGSFLYYSEDLDLYMAGTIDLIDCYAKTFALISEVMRAVQVDERGRVD